MLDIRYVRENLDAVVKAMENRNATFDADKFTELDEARRSSISQEESLQAERNRMS